MTLEYRVKGSNAIFSKTESRELSLSSAPVSVSIESSDQSSVGEETTFTVRISANASQNNLRDSMVFLLNRLRPLEPLPKVTIDHSISIKQKIDAIRNLLKNGKELSFKNLLSAAQSKTEVIVSFLAILELVKQQSVRFRQVDSFADLLVSKS